MLLLNLSDLRRDYKLTYKNQGRLAEKISFLIEVTKLEIYFRGAPSVEKKFKLSRLLQNTKKSLRTIQRWKKTYSLQGRQGLAPKKRGCPQKRPPSLQAASLIENYRREYRWGSEVIQAHLLRDHDIIMSRYKIDRYLNESGLREKYPCTTIKRVKAKRKKHTKKVVVHTPGEHTQMDVKYQLHLLTNKSKAYVYNFIDHASNWSYKMAYSAINAKNTERFMESLIKKCPFKIKRLQTDNGIEFTFKWTSKHPDDPKEHPLLKLANRESIKHKLIPPGEKELQGLVERSHRQDDQELFSRISPSNIEEFNHLLKEHCHWRNEKRRFKKLAWLTPNQALKLLSA